MDRRTSLLLIVFLVNHSVTANPLEPEEYSKMSLYLPIYASTAEYAKKEVGVVYQIVTGTDTTTVMKYSQVAGRDCLIGELITVNIGSVSEGKPNYYRETPFCGEGEEDEDKSLQISAYLDPALHVGVVARLHNNKSVSDFEENVLVVNCLFLMRNPGFDETSFVPYLMAPFNDSFAAFHPVEKDFLVVHKWLTEVIKRMFPAKFEMFQACSFFRGSRIGTSGLTIYVIVIFGVFLAFLCIYSLQSPRVVRIAW